MWLEITPVTDSNIPNTVEYMPKELHGVKRQKEDTFPFVDFLELA